MARRIVSQTTATPTATADTTNLANSSYPFVLQGGSATQINYIWEVSISGQEGSTSSPTFMILALDSTVGTTTGTSLSLFDSPINQATAALSSAPKTANTWTTVPQRSSTLHLLNASLNAFGGNYFWRANRLEEAMVLIGNAAPATGAGGEASLSAFTGGTPSKIGSHMIYESL